MRAGVAPLSYVPPGQQHKDSPRTEQGGSAYAEPALRWCGGPATLGRKAPFPCRAVYNNLYVNELFLRMSPCCYMTKTPGFDEIRLVDMKDITEAWNAASIQALRNRLSEGPLLREVRALPDCVVSCCLS